ncbi:CsbD family protein [Pacificimonas sp. WHA3]|uniref:CsbD family protein n=1 Tax=Pacificimonas pallii TaxID=2827236 RepID=A0ABS6SEA2_9SPHN|nr:CsbD family protein [Pacificimonas pallii]MBV7256590.1 CsbD family protein [Pacificimonas pallii]
MSEYSDKAEGKANQAAGNIKQGVGKLTGDKEMQREGQTQETKGDLQEGVGKVKGAVKDVIDDV